MDLDFWEGHSLPPEHVGLEFIHRVPSRRFDKSAQLIPASSTIHLGCATHMKGRIATAFLLKPSLLPPANRAPANS